MSNFAVQYGIVEAEAKINLPAETGAYLFFGAYQFGCGAGVSPPACDNAWNEIDELVFNSSTAGPSYGTSLFISKPGQASNSVNAGPDEGLASNHDSTGFCTGDASLQCPRTPFYQSAQGGCGNPTSGATNDDTYCSNCPAAPLTMATPFPNAAQLGIPATVAGGGTCPRYTTAAAQTYSNYKLVWTPSWIAWMINNTVMRNETWDVRQSFVPWRPVQLRPLLRTNSGAAPVLTGTIAAGASCGSCVGQVVTVPAGIVQNIGTGAVIANHIILPDGSSLFNLTASLSIADWAMGGCSPCNMFSTSPNIVYFNVKVTGVTLNFQSDGSVKVRRFKYTPYNTQAIANAIVQTNSWSQPAPTALAPQNLLFSSLPIPPSNLMWGTAGFSVPLQASCPAYPGGPNVNTAQTVEFSAAWSTCGATGENFVIAINSGSWACPLQNLQTLYPACSSATVPSLFCSAVSDSMAVAAAISSVSIFTFGLSPDRSLGLTLPITIGNGTYGLVTNGIFLGAHLVTSGSYNISFATRPLLPFSQVLSGSVSGTATISIDAPGAASLVSNVLGGASYIADITNGIAACFQSNTASILSALHPNVQTLLSTIGCSDNSSAYANGAGFTAAMQLSGSLSINVGSLTNGFVNIPTMNLLSETVLIKTSVANSTAGITVTDYLPAGIYLWRSADTAGDNLLQHATTITNSLSPLLAEIGLSLGQMSLPKGLGCGIGVFVNQFGAGFYIQAVFGNVSGYITCAYAAQSPTLQCSSYLPSIGVLQMVNSTAWSVSFSAGPGYPLQKAGVINPTGSSRRLLTLSVTIPPCTTCLAATAAAASATATAAESALQMLPVVTLKF